jgi:single-stranded-DNA-specific exonuclease
MPRIWNIAKPEIKLQTELKKELGISQILSQILINRGINEPEEAKRFLRSDLSDLVNPKSLPDIAVACARLKQAIRAKEKVMIFGDYDADGITATALLKSLLGKLGLEVLHYLPHRVKEGYGLNREAVRIAKEKSVSLFISVDCGTASINEIEELLRMKIDTIVIDHHQPTTEKLPPALALINPKRADSEYGYKDLAGVGVAYKFAQAITQEVREEDLDLVCLGTIADVVPLNGENRIIAKQGLYCLAQTKKPGLKALMRQSGMKDGAIDARSVSYIIGPRINASGRIDSAEVSLQLLMSESEAEAEELAKLVNRHNQKRQALESVILKEAQDIINKEVNFKDQRVIVVSKEGWHQGVLGIVASKLADRFYRPAIVISIADNLCRGSCRSIKNFHILEALLACKYLLKQFGGHSRAAGLSIAKDKIKDFQEAINCVARERIALEDLYPRLDIDLEAKLSDFDESVLSELGQLAPFGEGNREPVFYTKNLKLKSEPEVLGRDTLRLWVTDGDKTFKAVGFNLGMLKDEILESDHFDLAYTPSLDRWYEPAAIQLEIKDIRLFRPSEPCRP